MGEEDLGTIQTPTLDTHNLQLASRKMPRTKNEKADNRTAEEKYQHMVTTKVEREIFFGYYDGHFSGGVQGFDCIQNPIGSVLHYKKTVAQYAMTHNMFKSRAKKFSLLAQEFIEKNLAPSADERPVFSVEEIEELKDSQVDRRTPMEKLNDVQDPRELFIFYKYYDYYNTNGEIGFDLRNSGPGSVNHKNAYVSILGGIEDWTFRTKGKYLSLLAKEFFDANCQYLIKSVYNTRMR